MDEIENLVTAGDDMETGDTGTPSPAPPWSTPSPWVVPERPTPTATPVASPATADDGKSQAAAHRRKVAAAFAVALLLTAALAGRLPWHGERPILGSIPEVVSPASPPLRLFPSRPLPNPGGTGSTAEAGTIAANVKSGVVAIYSRFGAGSAGAGTGVILTPDGEVLTNNHVIEGATSISVTVSGSSQRYEAVIVGTAPTEDLAVLRIQGISGLKPVTLGDSSLVEVGDPVVALGNAGGVGGAPDVRTGTVRALDQTITAADQNGSRPRTLLGMIQTDAPLQPGDSGGPLVNRSSEVIGIDTAAGRDRQFRSADTVGFAIPSNRARSIAAQIQAGKSSPTVHIGAPGFLGVVLADKAPAGTVTPGAGPGSGALVMAVEPGSPAAAAGLLAGVTITAINGQSVADAAATVALVRTHHPGDTLMVSWTDSSNATHTAPVTLAAGWAD